MIESMSTNHLTVKDNAGRLESFNNATIEVVYILGDKFYKITSPSGEYLYNPSNIVFLKMK